MAQNISAQRQKVGLPVTSVRRVEADGVQVFYREAGDPQAPVVLLLHGFPTSSFMYRELIPRLADCYRVIAPDLPGFGFTEVPEKAEGNSAPPPGASVIVRSASRGTGFRADVDAAGNFSFSSDEIEPGVYELFAAAPGGLELRSVSANGTKVAGRKIEIGNGGDLRLTLTLARGVNARVKGIVERGGKPAAGMMVVLVPEDLRELGEYRRDQSDSDGSFSLNGVTPGKYTVVAVKDWSLEWGKPEVIQGYLAGGTPVEVAGGEERDIKVTAK